MITLVLTPSGLHRGLHRIATRTPRDPAAVDSHPAFDGYIRLWLFARLDPSLTRAPTCPPLTKNLQLKRYDSNWHVSLMRCRFFLILRILKVSVAFSQQIAGKNGEASMYHVREIRGCVLISLPYSVDHWYAPFCARRPDPRIKKRAGATVTSIGFEAARVIAKDAALVILAGRNQTKCDYIYLGLEIHQ